MSFVNMSSLSPASAAIFSGAQYRLLQNTVPAQEETPSALRTPHKEGKDDSSARRNLSRRAATSDSCATRSGQRSFLSPLCIACLFPAMSRRRTGESYSPPGDAVLQKKDISSLSFFTSTSRHYSSFIEVWPVGQRPWPLFSAETAFPRGEGP